MGVPYQPSLLRLLHAGTGLLVVAAWLSGLAVLLTLDRRFGSLPFPLPGDWVDIHGTAGVVLLPVALLFLIYAVTVGRRRLRRFTNLVPLLALVLAIGSGKLMDEDWLREGQLHHLVYKVHLSAWLLLAITVVLHLLGSLRLGGLPLLGSMVQLGWRPNDAPTAWWGQLCKGITGR